MTFIEKCGQPVRGGGTCVLHAGHDGYHSIVDHGYCDGCGRQMRSAPAARSDVWVGDYNDDSLAFCFICVKQEERERDKYPPMGMEVLER